MSHKSINSNFTIVVRLPNREWKRMRYIDVEDFIANRTIVEVFYPINLPRRAPAAARAAAKTEVYTFTENDLRNLTITDAVSDDVADTIEVRHVPGYTLENDLHWLERLLSGEQVESPALTLTDAEWNDLLAKIPTNHYCPYK